MTIIKYKMMVKRSDHPKPSVQHIDHFFTCKILVCMFVVLSCLFISSFLSVTRNCLCVAMN